MIYKKICLLFTLALIEAQTTRKQCQLPNPIYSDVVNSPSKVPAFGVSSVDQPRWSYASPSDWKNIYPECAGNRQSPINIVTSSAVSGNSDTPQITYLSKSSSKSYTQNTVTYTNQVDGEYGSIQGLDTTKNYTYYAIQFHIHIPSEHQINGVNADLEVHFVHIASASQNSDCNNISNKLTVYGLLFNRQANASNYTVFETMQNKNSNVTSFDLSEFLNKLTDQTYYHYYGSLTNPPCWQTVSWYVFGQVLPINNIQFSQFASQYTNTTLYGSNLTNSRPVQNLNNRTITTGKGLVGSVSVISEGESNGLIITILCILYLIL